MRYPQESHYDPDPSHLDLVSPGGSPVLQGLEDFLPQEAGWASAGIKILYVKVLITCYSFPPPSSTLCPITAHQILPADSKLRISKG